MKVRLIFSAIAATLLLASCSSDQTTRTDDGEIVEGGELGVFSVQEGDCINFPEDDSNAGVLFDAVACDAAHDGEIYELFDIPGDTFPGEIEVSDQSEAGCLEAFEPFVGIDYNSSIYYFTFLSPSDGSWSEGDREVICIITPATGEPQLTQSLEGAAA